MFHFSITVSSDLVSQFDDTWRFVTRGKIDIPYYGLSPTADCGAPRIKL